MPALYLQRCLIVIGIDINIKVIVASLTTREANGQWLASQVVNDTTMTKIEVSISYLLWWKQMMNKQKKLEMLKIVPNHRTTSQKGQLGVIQAIRSGQVTYKELGQSNPCTRWGGLSTPSST